MKIERKHLLGVAVACVFASGILGLVSNVQAEVIILDFVVPAGTAITTGTGDDKDVLVFTGRPSGSTAVGTCGAGDHPVQNGVFVDPGGNRATRIIGVIPVSQSTAVAAGTRVRNLQSLGTCGTSGEYDKYRGEVQ